MEDVLKLQCDCKNSNMSMMNFVPAEGADAEMSIHISNKVYYQFTLTICRQHKRETHAQWRFLSSRCAASTPLLAHRLRYRISLYVSSRPLWIA